MTSMVFAELSQSLGTVHDVPEVRKMTVACAWIGKRERAAKKEKSSSAGSGCWKLLRDDVRVICWNCSVAGYVPANAWMWIAQPEVTTDRQIT